MKRSALFIGLCAASISVNASASDNAATSDKAACIAIASKQKEGVCNLSGLSRNDAREVLQAAVNADPRISPQIANLVLVQRAGDVFKGMGGLDKNKAVCLDNKHNFTNCKGEQP